MAEVIKNKIQLKRGPGAPSRGLLDVGEPGYDSANKRLYIGNGLKEEDDEATAIPTKQDIIDEIAKAQLSSSGVDLSGYATKEYVNNSIKDVDVDLTGYATEEYVEEALKDISVEDVVYADDNGENDALAPINATTLGGVPADEYATQRFVEDKIIEAKLDTEETDIDFTDFVRKEDLEKLNFPVDSVNGKTGAVELNASDVGAAPAGYGLGGSAISFNDLNDATNCGWWTIESDTLNRPFDYGMGMTINRYGSRYTQIAFNPVMNGCGEICVRSKGTTEWEAWEYMNPPMYLNTEYRTTERRGGKSVYVKRISFGALPASGSSNVPTGISGGTLVSLTGTFYLSGGDAEAYPVMGGSGPKCLAWVSAGCSYLYTQAIVDCSKHTGEFVIKYTKD